MTLAGVSSREVGLHVKTHRPVSAERQQSIFEAAGRDGFYDYNNNPYSNRLLEVDFFVMKNSFPDLRNQIRQVAAWLKRKGAIHFSDDPDGMYYEGAMYQSPRLEQALTSSGRFGATFLCQPFLYGQAEQFEVVGLPSVSVPITYSGTHDACCQIIVRNIGQTPVNNVKLTLISRR